MSKINKRYQAIAEDIAARRIVRFMRVASVAGKEIKHIDPNMDSADIRNMVKVVNSVRVQVHWRPVFQTLCRTLLSMDIEPAIPIVDGIMMTHYKLSRNVFINASLGYLEIQKAVDTVKAIADNLVKQELSRIVRDACITSLAATATDKFLKTRSEVDDFHIGQPLYKILQHSATMRG